MQLYKKLRYEVWTPQLFGISFCMSSYMMDWSFKSPLNLKPLCRISLGEINLPKWKKKKKNAWFRWLKNKKCQGQMLNFIPSSRAIIFMGSLIDQVNSEDIRIGGSCCPQQHAVPIRAVHVRRSMAQICLDSNRSVPLIAELI